MRDGARRGRVMVALLALLGAALVPTPQRVAGGADTNWDLPQTIPSPGMPWQPHTDGQTVVWISQTGTGPFTDVFGADLATGATFQIVSDGDYASNVDIADGVVVWEESPECPGCEADVHGMVVSSGERFTVAATAAHEHDPVVTREWMAWLATSEAGQELRVQRLQGADDPITLVTTNTLVRGLTIDGDRLAWTEAWWEEQGFVRDLLTMRIGDVAPTLLFRQVEIPTYTDHAAETSIMLADIGVDIAGDLLVTINVPQATLLVFDLTTGVYQSLYIDGEPYLPTTDGRFVIWEDRSVERGSLPRGVVLRAYDLQTQSAFLTAESPGFTITPHLRGDTLVWLDCDGDQCRLRVSPMLDRLPTAARSAHATVDGVSYFPETGHTLAAGFGAFWNAHGALPVFGYPLTEEFTDWITDTGSAATAQYTERQRFEWNPDGAGTPYEVLLGRLGSDLLDIRGRDDSAFAPGDPNAPHYQAQTQHAIGEMFYGYWSGHGLEFGDTGVSFRESLALFGYPLSEPLMETNADGDTVLTQYFERAVFEWHPENAGTPYEVLLRRVGYELLIARGWVP